MWPHIMHVHTHYIITNKLVLCDVIISHSIQEIFISGRSVIHYYIKGYRCFYNATFNGMPFSHNSTYVLCSFIWFDLILSLLMVACSLISASFVMCSLKGSYVIVCYVIASARS
jgi:hypothetical protein